jgi:hypothetical protein
VQEVTIAGEAEVNPALIVVESTDPIATLTPERRLVTFG